MILFKLKKTPASSAAAIPSLISTPALMTCRFITTCANPKNSYRCRGAVEPAGLPEAVFGKPSGCRVRHCITRRPAKSCVRLPITNWATATFRKKTAQLNASTLPVENVTVIDCLFENGLKAHGRLSLTTCRSRSEPATLSAAGSISSTALTRRGPFRFFGSLSRPVPQHFSFWR